MSFIKRMQSRLSNKNSKYDSTEAYIFFNCDEEKSQSSMNPHYNKQVYSSARSGRRALWDRIKEEKEAGRIQFDEADFPVIRNLILEGNPNEAGQYIRYGEILPLELF